MDRDFLRLIIKNVVPRRLDGIWQYLIIACALLVYVESASWIEGRVYDLMRISGLAFLIILHNYCARWLVGHRLNLTRTQLKSFESKPGEDTDAMWRAIS